MIVDPALLARLEMDDATFREWIFERLAEVGPRPCTDADVERALGYPFQRPTGSFRLRGGAVEPLEAVEAADRADRVALLAIGSNGAPGHLAVKLAHLPEPERDVVGVAGELHDVDVGVAALPTAYGSMPSTLFASPGTAVRAAVLWVTPVQLQQLTWTEISYRLGRLEPVRFTGDVPGGDVEAAWAFVSRWGTFCPDGEPVALGAFPARGRTAPPLSQAELLDRVARIVLGPDAVAQDVVEAVFADFHLFARSHGEQLVALGRALPAAGWSPLRPA